VTDVHNDKTRSFNMSRIRSKDTKPEMIVRRFLHSKGLRYRLHDKKLPGKPDIILKKLNTVVFVNGCFWHGHEGCKYFVIPKTRTDWWLNKICKTQTRDLEQYNKLKADGWKIIIVWECELHQKKRDHTLIRLYDSICK